MRLIFTEKQLRDFAEEEQILLARAHAGNERPLLKFWYDKRVKYCARVGSK
jgi:hypothetical protein